MTAAEKKMIEKNLDLLFEFEKYVLEDPEITEKIPRDRIHEIGRESKIQPVERALGETASQEGPTAHFRYGEETEPGSFAYQGTRFRACRLIRICSNRYVKPSVGGGKTPGLGEHTGATSGKSVKAQDASYRLSGLVYTIISTFRESRNVEISAELA